jgi:predicted Zn-dependent protease with MMP-like domain
MTREKFESIAENLLNKLPKIFGNSIDNVYISIEDLPSDEDIKKTRSDKRNLLGLYQGIPLKYRGPWYGTSPTVPDKISLFQRNIEALCGSDAEIEFRIEEVLFHEIGHYLGMNEAEIRNAMRSYNSL